MAGVNLDELFGVATTPERPQAQGVDLDALFAPTAEVPIGKSPEDYYRLEKEIRESHRSGTITLEDAQKRMAEEVGEAGHRLASDFVAQTLQQRTDKFKTDTLQSFDAMAPDVRQQKTEKMLEDYKRGVDAQAYGQYGTLSPDKRRVRAWDRWDESEKQSWYQTKNALAAIGQIPEYRMKELQERAGATTATGIEAEGTAAKARRFFDEEILSRNDPVLNWLRIGDTSVLPLPIPATFIKRMGTRLLNVVSHAADTGLVATNQIAKAVRENENPLLFPVRLNAVAVNETLDWFGVRDKMVIEEKNLDGQVVSERPANVATYYWNRLKESPEEMGLFEAVDPKKYAAMSTGKKILTRGLFLASDVILPGGEMALGAMLANSQRVARAVVSQDIAKGVISGEDAVQSVVDIGKSLDLEAGLKTVENPVFPIDIVSKDRAILKNEEVAGLLESLDRSLGKAMTKTGDDADAFVDYQKEVESFTDRLLHNPTGLTYKLGDSEVNKLINVRDGLIARIEQSKQMAGMYESMLDLRKARQVSEAVPGYERIIQTINGHLAAQTAEYVAKTPTKEALFDRIKMAEDDLYTAQQSADMPRIETAQDDLNMAHAALRELTGRKVPSVSSKRMAQMEALAESRKLRGGKAVKAPQAQGLPTAKLAVAPEAGLTEAVSTTTPFHTWMDEGVALKAADLDMNVIEAGAKFADTTPMKVLGDDPSLELQKLIMGEEITAQELLKLDDPVGAAVRGWPEAGAIKLGVWKNTGDIIATSKKIPGAYENVTLPLLDGARNMRASVGRMVDRIDGLWKTVDYDIGSRQRVSKWLSGEAGDDTLSAQELFIAKEHRAYYDEAIKQLNIVRKSEGKKPVNYIVNYEHRLVEEFEELKSNPFVARRGGGTTVYDAYESMMSYIPALSYQIHMHPQVAHARQFTRPFEVLAGLVTEGEGAQKTVKNIIKITETPHSVISMDMAARNSWTSKTYEYVPDFEQGEKVVRAINDTQIESAKTIADWLNGYIDYVGTGKANAMFRDMAAEFKLKGMDGEWVDTVFNAMSQAVYAPFLNSPSYSIKNLSQSVMTVGDIGWKYTGKGFLWYGKTRIDKTLRKWALEELLGGSSSNLAKRSVRLPGETSLPRKIATAPARAWLNFNKIVGTLSFAPGSEDLNKIVAGMAHFEKSLDTQAMTNPVLKTYLDGYGLNPLKLREAFPKAYKQAKFDAIAGFNRTQFSYERALTPPMLRNRLLRTTVPFIRYPISKAGYVTGLHTNLGAHLYAKEFGMATEDFKKLSRYYAASVGMAYLASRYIIDYRDAIGYSPNTVQYNLSPNEEGRLADTMFRASPLGANAQLVSMGADLVVGEGVTPVLGVASAYIRKLLDGNTSEANRAVEKANKTAAKMIFGIQGVRVYDAIMNKVYGRTQNEQWNKVSAKIDALQGNTKLLVAKRIASEILPEDKDEILEKYSPTMSMREFMFKTLGAKTLTRSDYERAWYIAETEMQETDKLADRAAKLLYEIGKQQGNVEAKQSELTDIMRKHSDRLTATMIKQRAAGMLKEDDASKVAALINTFAHREE